MGKTPHEFSNKSHKIAKCNVEENFIDPFLALIAED
jgi:hypothetical protein